MIHSVLVRYFFYLNVEISLLHHSYTTITTV
nr:MAG TPA: hypothetical protein [Caudoviricetes sp.]